MADAHAPTLNPTDAEFYLDADEFFQRHRLTALTYDDVTLATRYSEVLPRETQLDVRLAPGLDLRIPIVSSDMDTVTEHQMAIAMALQGGLGLIHYNMSDSDQLSEVARVKNHVHGLIQEPIKVSPDQTIGAVLETIETKRFAFSTFPVVDDSGRLLGLLPGYVVRHRYANRLVRDVLTPRDRVNTIQAPEIAVDPIGTADRFFSANPGTNKLLVVDTEDHLRGLFTLSDIDRITQERNALSKPARDSSFRLICGAALATPRLPDGQLDRDRLLTHVTELVERGVDVVAVSTAHGHSAGVGQTVRLVREQFPNLPIIAGNVTSGAGVEYLAECGANCIKVGQGPGSICTTRLVAGVGVPQLTALYIASKAVTNKGITLLADGGINKSGDIVKALTLAHAAVCGGLLAGCSEAPGQIIEINGKLYKQYRGMGSLPAMKAGSAARYGHGAGSVRKAAAEGVEALKEVAGSVETVVNQLVGGIQAGLGYLGAANLEALRRQARFIQISPAGLREAAPHDIVEVKTSTSS